MSALEDLKKLRETVRIEVSIIKSLMPYINPTQMTSGGEQQYIAATRALENLQRLVQTNSGKVGITVPTGGLGVKGR